MIFPPDGLYAITNVLPGTEPNHLASQVVQAISGGAVMIQYRDKIHGPAERRQFAAALQTICAQLGAPLIINDEIELAAEVGAAGVHLGKDDADVSSARARLGSSAIIGVSCYNSFERAATATEQRASYVAFGSMFPSQTKPNAVRADINLITRARKELTIPIAAIGGISTQNAAMVIDAGAHWVAVVGGIFGGDDIESNARAFAQLFAKRDKAPASAPRSR
jgi:thiamine-phosphate pyrophosphorylase